MMMAHLMTRMNPRGQVAPQALLENVFENQELGEGRGFNIGPVAMAKPVRDPSFLRARILSAALDGLRKGSKTGCQKVGLKTVTSTTRTTTDRLSPIWTPGAEPLI